MLAKIVKKSVMTFHALSIPVNTKFGKVSIEEVEMTSYQLDTSAVALMLYENSNLYVELLTYVPPQHKETVSGIEVVTYTMVDGKIVETKMPKKYVFTEDYSEKYQKISFSAQEVRVGSVIEIKYDFTSSLYWEIDLFSFNN